MRYENELEDRVGHHIANNLSDEQLDELDCFLTHNVPNMEEWLTEHVPGYLADPRYADIKEEMPDATKAEILEKYGILMWLEFHCPDYRQIVRQEKSRASLMETIATLSPSADRLLKFRRCAELPINPELQTIIESPPHGRSTVYARLCIASSPMGSRHNAVVLGPSPAECLPSPFIYQGPMYTLEPISEPMTMDWMLFLWGGVEEAEKAVLKDFWRELEFCVVADRISPDDMSCWFLGCVRLKAIIGAQLIDTSHVISMSNAFAWCRALTTLDTSTWKTPNVVNFRLTFFKCCSLNELNMAQFDFSKATTTEGMFEDCISLRSIVLPQIAAPKLKCARKMFSQCIGLRHVTFSDAILPTLRDTVGMFAWCLSLQQLDLSGISPNYLEDMAQMFYRCESLEHLKLPGLEVDGEEVWMEDAFWGCRKLEQHPGTLSYFLMSGQGIDI